MVSQKQAMGGTGTDGNCHACKNKKLLPRYVALIKNNPGRFLSTQIEELLQATYPDPIPCGPKSLIGSPDPPGCTPAAEIPKPAPPPTPKETDIIYGKFRGNYGCIF
jgi:hypothetical protein